MFGKPHWFRKKKIGWGLTPITFRGWVYAVTWLTAAGGFLMYDIRHIMVAMKPPASADDVLYIGDDEPARNRLATRNFDFQVRR